MSNCAFIISTCKGYYNIIFRYCPSNLIDYGNVNIVKNELLSLSFIVYFIYDRIRGVLHST